MSAGFGQEIRHAWRRLLATPGLLIAGTLLLALGIGAATAIFSVVDAMLFDPLVPGEDRVFILHETQPESDVALSEISLPHFHDWREMSTSFQEMAAFGASNTRSTLLLERGEPVEVDSAGVSPTFFDTLRVRPVLGRGFRIEEDELDSDHVVVISHELWQRALGADPNILGRRITLERSTRDSYSIVGVMPRGFAFPNGARLWTPLRKEEPFWPGRGWGVLVAVGRLAPGVTPEQAKVELDSLIPQIYRDNDLSQAVTRRVRTVPITDYFLGENTRSALSILQAAVAMLYFIACVNLASLFLAHTLSRGRDVAIRTALGASRAHIVRMFLAETVIVSLAGGALGIVIARAALGSMIALAPARVPRLDGAELDGRVLAFTVLIAAVAALLVALGPVMGSTEPSLAAAMAGGRAGATRQSVRLRQALVFSEVVVTVILVVGAGLMMTSLLRLMDADLGYDPDRVLLLDVKGPPEDYASLESKRSLLERSLERVEALGDVSEAGAVLVPPFGAGTLGWDLWWVAESQNAPWETIVREHPETGESVALSQPSLSFMEQNPRVNWEAISEGYFRALAIPLLSGRTFTGEDTDDAPRVVIVSASFAQNLWPNDDPIGKRIITLGHRRDENRRAEWQTVVGVVGDARYREVTGTRLDIYIPYQQSEFIPNVLAVRAPGDALAAVAGIRAAVRKIDPNVRIERVRTLESVVNGELMPWRFHSTLVTTFAAVGLVLAALGIFGMVAQSVSQRAREIGLRMVLGADATAVLNMVVGQGMRPVLLGLTAGLVIAFSSARVLAAHLYEVSPGAPSTYVCVGVLVTIVAAIACYIPARRAARLDPGVTLRSE